jgi:PEP-CTERM motif
MKARIIVSVVATFGFCLVSQAGITSATWWTESSQSFTGAGYSFHDALLAASGVQYASSAKLVGTIQTDTPSDPTLTLGSTVNNDTGNPWLGYQVNIAMDQPFTFTTPGPSVNNAPANDWFVASIVAPTLQISGPYAGKYEGTLLFSEGTPVGVGGTLDWAYSISFGSSTDYSFTQEMIPLFSPIPEPSALALIGMGGLILVLHLARKYRRVV